ncbi:24751_t:CDS:2, partial [Gigaspora margarita]
WCQGCATRYFKDNFDNWTSGNQNIDEIIKETQMNSKLAIDFVEWIPYEQFEQIEKINRGGFGTIYSAVWKQGPLSMNENRFRQPKNILRRTKNIQVALKGGISTEYLKELCMQIKCCTSSNLYANSLTGRKVGRSPILRFYGLTKRPISEDSDEYMLVIQFAKGGNLLTYLSTNFNQMKWLEDKLPILAHIAYGLKIIHKEGLIHRDLHHGNILINNNIPYISDFGLSHPYNREDSTTDKLFGVVPFIAPEVLSKRQYTPKSDVYSFGIIMWMFTFGHLPFRDHRYDTDLALKIFNGSRPPIINGTPSCFINLMQRCWNHDPEQRPTSSEIYDIMVEWYYLKNYKEFKALDKILLSQNTQVVELPTIQNVQDVEPPMMQNTQEIEPPMMQNNFDTSHSLIDTSEFPGIHYYYVLKKHFIDDVLITSVFRFRHNKLENRRLVI